LRLIRNKAARTGAEQSQALMPTSRHAIPRGTLTASE
jgi:hypothetical protein